MIRVSTTAILAMATLALADPIEVPIDPTTSEAEVELCVSGVCDTDTSDISGFITVELDCDLNPQSVTLHDFDFVMEEDLDLFLVYITPANALDVKGTGGAVSAAEFGLPAGPVPLTDDAYAIYDVPALIEGQFAYVATGFICTLFQTAGYLCDSSIDLSTFGPQNIETFSGTLDVADDVLTITVELSYTTPLDPDNPGLGTFTTTGTLYGSVPVPPRGDINGDCFINLLDFATFAVCYGEFVSNPLSDCTMVEADRSDLDRDGRVELEDFASFAFNYGT